MLRRLALLLLALPLAGCPTPVEEIPLPELTEPPLHVDLFIGTGGQAGGSSNTFPGPVLPWGMIQPGPDTASSTGSRLWWNHAAGYHYGDELLLGFSHARTQGVSTPDLGAVLLMPAVGRTPAELATVEGRRLPFEHDREEAWLGYYAVEPGDEGLSIEVTTTERVAHYRIGGADALVFDLGHAQPETEVLDASLHVDVEAGVVQGWTQHSGRFTDASDGGLVTFFHARIDAPIAAVHSGSDGAPVEGVVDVAGPSALAVLELGSTDSFEVRVGISYVDLAGARANLEAEIPDNHPFLLTLAFAEERWRDVLGGLRFGGGTEDERTILATALYHSFVMPTVFADADGRYRGFDHEVHEVDFAYHSMFSLWDTYRTVHPLLCLLQPERQLDQVRSLIRMGQDGGHVPRWPLGHGYTNVTIGTSADVVVAETALRGIGPFDQEEALDLLLTTAAATPEPGHEFSGREGVLEYLELGWVPEEVEGRSVARTLEFAVADHALGSWAETLGRPEATELLDRGQSYRHLWNPELQVFDGRHDDGSWVGVNPDAYEGDGLYYGGSAMHYAWMAPHDMDGLIELNGGAEAFATRLDAWFQATVWELEGSDILGIAPPVGYYHGNEPDIHAPWLFVAAGRPDLAARWVRWAAQTHYLAAPNGIMGNEDAGALSAWYVLAAIGLYPIPGSDRWILGAPLLPLFELDVAGGVLRIEAPGAGPERPYVTAITLDGEPVEEPWIAHATLAAGGVLRFEMGEEPPE
jgi:predicted alpha-1,2-mannosidase